MAASSQRSAERQAVDLDTFIDELERRIKIFQDQIDQMTAPTGGKLVPELWNSTPYRDTFRHQMVLRGLVLALRASDAPPAASQQTAED